MRDVRQKYSHPRPCPPIGKAFIQPVLVTQRLTVIKTASDYLLDNDNVSQDAQMRLSGPAKALRSSPHTAAAGVVALALGVSGAWVVPSAAQQQPEGSLDHCLEVVANGGGGEISCTYRALLTDQERADMQALSRGLLEDARCVVKVRIERKQVEEALAKADHTFQAPPQPVSCDIKTKNGEVPITGTFAPNVTFKGDTAIDGSPGLANIAGVNKYLAWPIVQYVNRAPSIRKSMLEMIDQYRARLRRIH